MSVFKDVFSGFLCIGRKDTNESRLSAHFGYPIRPKASFPVLNGRLLLLEQ
jgi:hypothetical protein